jgi:hypothetical protein
MKFKLCEKAEYYEFAREGNFTINLIVNKLLSINFVNKNKQISKEGPATNGNHSMVIYGQRR